LINVFVRICNNAALFCYDNEVDMNQKNILLLVGALVLTGCGGGESGDGSEPSPLANKGNFQNSYETGVFFSHNGNGTDYNFGINSELCQSSYRDRYYETENTLIFGNPNLPDEDFFIAADWVESALDTALAAMEISKAEYYAARTEVSLTARQQLRQGLSYLSESGQRYGSFTYPNNFDQFTDDETITAWQVHSAQQASFTDVATTLVADSHSGYTSADEIRLENKIYVCLHENNFAAGWGEGHLAGINIGANSVYKPNNTAQIIVHELVHSLQYALTANVEGLRLPRWFSEGQAVYLSKMNVADKSNHNEYAPTAVVDFSDEVGDPGLAYQHYGLAYQYLQAANGLSTIKTMMQRVKSDDYKAQADSTFVNENANYIQAFDALMLDINQTPLTVADYRIHYHSYLSDYAARP